MIERWTPKIKQEQVSEGMTLRMWTDKDGEYVLHTDFIERVKKLEGWLKYLWKHYWYRGDDLPETEKEIFDYIKAMEAKETP